jgi:hypothetical protein
MSSSAPRAGERALDVEVTDDALTVHLADGRSITVPLAWYPRLFDATPEQRLNWQLLGGGLLLRWEDIDEDLSVEGLLRGAPAPPASLANLEHGIVADRARLASR